jgi:hypothetical protein
MPGRRDARVALTARGANSPKLRLGPMRGQSARIMAFKGLPRSGCHPRCGHDAGLWSDPGPGTTLKKQPESNATEPTPIVETPRMLSNSLGRAKFMNAFKLSFGPRLPTHPRTRLSQAPVLRPLTALCHDTCVCREPRVLLDSFHNRSDFGAPGGRRAALRLGRAFKSRTPDNPKCSTTSCRALSKGVRGKSTSARFECPPGAPPQTIR